MNVERLTLLRDKLLSFTPEQKKHFSLEIWIGLEDALTGLSLRERLMAECGTAACAVGWACLMHEFIAQNLRFSYDENLGAYAPVFERDDGKRLYGWDAVTAFFDIDEQVADELFVMESYYHDDDRRDPPGPEHVAERITALLAS